MYVTKYSNIWILFIRWGRYIIKLPYLEGNYYSMCPLLLWTHQSHIPMQCICHTIADFKFLLHASIKMGSINEILIWDQWKDVVVVVEPKSKDYLLTLSLWWVSCCPCCCVNVVNYVKVLTSWSSLISTIGVYLCRHRILLVLIRHSLDSFCCFRYSLDCLMQQIFYISFMHV